MSSYDDLLRQVESLRVENSTLQRELHDNSTHLVKLENEATSLRESLNQSQAPDGEADYSFNDELTCGEHLAVYEESNEVNDSQNLLDPVANDNSRDQGHQRSNVTEADDLESLRQDEEHLLSLMHQYDKERTNLRQQIEAEEKNRKWYYEQIEMASRKIRSLPMNDPHSKQTQQGWTRKHLEFEISRLQETMHESFGTNELIEQRREARVQRIRQIEAELKSLQQQHQEQVQRQSEVNLTKSHNGHLSSNSGEMDQVAMSAQTNKNGLDVVYSRNPNIPAMYHGTWPIEKDDNAQGPQGHHDLASVMSFNSTNTSSSQGSGSGGQRLPQQQNLQQQQQQQQPVTQPLVPQQLGTKVEMVYGLLSMLGTHDKDDMSRTLLAMSSSQDSCIAMRQSGCLPLLIQLLHGSDKDSALLGNTRGSKAARARAAAALHNIVHSHPDDKRGRREARVLRLLEQIRAHCDQLREMSSEEEEGGKDSVPLNAQMDHHPGYAIAALMKLSFDEEHRHAICTLGGLHAIAELLQVDHEVNRDTSEQYNITMRRYACMALTNLTFGDGTNKASLCSMKPAMRALVSQLFSSNEELCQVAASVLRNLSWKADLASKKTLREVEAVTSLMQGAMVVTKETTLKSILSALWNLSAHCSENKADICAVEGALVFLIVSLTYKSPSKTTAIIENGGGILRNVSSHIAVREDYRKCLRQHGCLQILLKHLRSPSLTIVSNACGTLWNLSARSAEDQQALWEMGAVNMLRNLVNSKHKMISMGSSAALKNLLAARPAMKNLELNKQGNMNRPTLHVRKQRALESEIDQNLSETCENVESPRDSPVESKKSEAGVFVYPVYSMQDGEHRRSLLRAGQVSAGQVIPRSQSGGDNSLSLENQISNQQRVSRSGSQDSVGSTHSDISHDRSRANMTNRTQVNMGGSLDRNKDTLQSPAKRHNSDGRCERNPLGPPNSRILQVMQEVAMHAGLEGQGSQNKGDAAVFKTPFPVPQGRVPHPQRQGAPSQQEGHHHPAMNAQQSAAMYQMYMMQKSNKHEHCVNNNNQQENNDEEKPLDYSLKYRENNSQSECKDRKGHTQGTPPKQPLVGNFVRNPQKVFFDRHMMNNRFHFNSEYAETDLDAPDQVTDFSARYGAEYQNQQYSGQRYNNYEDSDPNCADCKLEEARRYNDRLEQTMEHDQVTMFYTEDTPYLSTATSLTDLSTAAKILEEAQNQFSGNERDYNDGDEMQNFSSKYAEQDNGHGDDDVPEVIQQSQSQGHRYNDTEHSSRSGSQTTDHCTGTTVIPNYNLSKADKYTNQSDSHSLTHSNDDLQERSFHNTCSEDAPDDQTKTYCEEGTPVCFSRVSSLSSLHSSEANDRQEKRPSGPLQSIKENEDFKNNSLVKVQQPSSVSQHSGRQKNDGMDSRDMNESAEKEHKTVTFDEKEHIQETPMMFSRCTSLGSLSSFDTQSVHSSVFSEYSRRASENVSPSELPDSPSESMPSSPGRVKSPDRYHEKKPSVRQELFPESLPPQFTNKAGGNVKRVHPLTAFMALGKNIQIGSSNRQFDIESTSSCKSEAPVVYADEGTPPICQDNLSTLSEITTDNYDINDKTLTENPGSGSNHSNRSTGSHEDANTTIYKTPIRKPQLEADLKQKTQPNTSEHTKPTDPTGGCIEQEKVAVVHTKFENDSKTDKCSADKGHSSNSDVSEGEDDLLANIISSAMPNSSKKIRKSSSDNAIKRKSSSSSKADSGSSSRSKTPAKTPIDSPAGKSGISKRVHPSSSNPGSQNETPLKDRTKVKPYCETNASGNKNKSMLPKPAASHRDVRRVLNDDPASLNCSIDSTKSDTPFNMSNTLSIINRPIQEKPQARSDSQNSNLLIMQKVENLKDYEDDGEDEGIKTYATEDTPFSGSIPASPRNERKFNGGGQHNVDLNEDSVTTFATEDTPFSGSIPASPRNERKFHGVGQPPVDLNQDSVTTFATEGTPFSGSMPGSPKANRSSNFNYLDMEPDTVKCYNTEDTPFTGSAPESPKMARTERISQPGGNQNQFKQMHSTPSHHASTPSHHASAKTTHSDTLRNANPLSFHQRQPLAIDTSEDTVRSYATEGTPYNQSNVPSPKPSDTKNPSTFNPAMLGNMDCIGNAFEASEDQLKTFATEGTPLNFSRTGSFSDLSSLNTNFEEKVKIDPVEESVNDHNLDDTHSDNSSLMEENEELLSEIIQSAMPAAKPGKTGRKSLDRKTDESSEGKGNISFDSSSSKSKASKVPAKFQPQRTSSLAHDSALSNLLRMQNEEDYDEDQVRTFVVEDTPNNASVKTSLSDLTIDNDSITGMKASSKNHLEARKPSAGNLTGQGDGSNYTYPSLSGMYGTWNDSVFIQSGWGGGDSMQVFKTEGTPQTFSCNDSLSTLSMLDDDSKDEVSKHIASLAEQITCKSGKEHTKDEAKSVLPEVKVKDNIQRSESRSSDHSSSSVHSVKDLERHVVGQSSEDHSVHDEDHSIKRFGDEVKKYGVEDTPLCFSQSSSLSSINETAADNQREFQVNHPIQMTVSHKTEKFKQPVKDQKTSYKVEHTPLCFSRNSSLSSLSIHSDEDDDPEDLALLEDCISSALPPPTRPNKTERRRSSHGSKGEHAYRKTRSDKSTAKYNNNHHSSSRNCSSADELETSGTHDSRYTSWRQQPQKSCDEIFKRPTLDAKGRPCRRSRSQDSEHKMLKQYKDSSNKEIAQQYVEQETKYGHGTAVYNSLPRNVYRNEDREEIEKQRQQIISESQNLTRSIEHQVRELENRTHKMGVGRRGSGEKSDEHENEKNDSPTSGENFFMTCSGMTEISVESISKQSMPSNMVPYDTDDDILESSLMGSRFGGDGDESNMLMSGHERTLTGSMSANTTLTDRSGTRFTQPNLPMDLSITSEDEKALAVNASIVMSEMAVNRMGTSAYSNVEDDRFIEHETLSLVSNDYISDTASENSITWSLSSERTSEYTESLASTECGSPQTRRPRIVKPEDKADNVQVTDADLKAVRGKRKPLYHSKSVSSAPSTSMPMTPRPDPQPKGRNLPVHSTNKPTPRGLQAGATNVVPKKATSTLRTQPQACSTPVKANPTQKAKTTNTTQPQRSSSLDQKSLNVKNNSAQRLANYSSEYSTPTKIPSKTSPRSKTEGGEAKPKPKTLSKQGTFVKETTNRNAPVISPDDKANYNSNGRLRYNDGNSSGSSKSINSNNVSIGSEDSPRDKSHSSTQDSVSIETTPKKKDPKLRRSLGTSQLSNSKKNLQSPGTVGTKIPSPSKSNLTKTGTAANGKKTPGKPAPLLKTSSGSSLVKTNSGSNSSLKKLGSQQDVKKSGSNSSLRANSRPTTPVVKDAGKPTENGKKGAKKALTSKISSLLKKEEKPIKGKSVSKLPIAKPKKVTNEPTKRDSSPRPSINRNTVILSEASLELPVVDGISRSSTYDKLKATNEYSQIPSHDITNQSSSSDNTNNESVDLDKTKKFDHEFEVGVEYSLDDAWASRVEKSIEAMSRSIEENNKQSKSAYGEHDIDISKMNFSDSPAKRLSKSGSMSEIELEFGRIHSGTWKKKKSHNDFAMLPNADETSKTLPLVKRAESLNFNMGRSSECLSQYDSESEDVWIRRDDKMRMSDNSMSVKSKRKTFKGSSSFLPIKNVVSKVFGSKKTDKQGKSVTEFDKQSRSFVTEKELKKMNESNTRLNKKEKDLRMNKSEIIKPSKSDLKAEAKISKAELKAEAKQIKAEAKQKKAEMKALKKGSKLQQSLEVKRRDGESQNLNSSLTSLKKSAEDLIDIDKSDEEDNGTMHLSLTKSAKNIRAPHQTTNNARRNSNNKVVDSGAIENGTLGKNESVFYSQAVDHQVTEKLSPNKSSSESLNSRSNQSPVLNRSAKQSPTSQHATKTEMLLARRQQILNSTSSQDRSDTEDENKRKCIVTTV